MDSPTPADLGLLAPWAPELAETFVALSCDLALLLDDEGVILKIAQHAARPVAPEAWIGQNWGATVAPDSRPKSERMLADVAKFGAAGRRELNHPGAVGGEAALAYAAVRLGEQGPILVIGHDLREAMAMQQRFVIAQQALERSYWNAQSRPSPVSAPDAALPRMTAKERASLGISPANGATVVDGTDEAEDARLLEALDQLYDRIDLDALPGLLRDARRAAERHFLQRALARAGSLETLADWLGVSPNTLARRVDRPIKSPVRRNPRGAG
ncbi:MAG: transcriptional regulator PpsR [Pseudomonadota bacterium]|jgi:hypothetical protein